MLISSLLSTDNPFNSTEEIKEWIRRRNNEVTVDVKQIAFSEMEKWQISKSSIDHTSGRFFSIVGIDVTTDYGKLNNWRQPIINQPEVGYLGILTKVIDGTLYCLMQAKIEPGNVNCVQISPTLQATKSNYSRVHAGKSPKYLEYFINAKPENIILDQLQSEQGARFLRKRNRNIIIKVDEDVPVLPDFCWINRHTSHYINPYYLIQDSNRPLALLTSICAFMYFKNLKVPYNKYINMIGASIFGVLLIHANSDTMRQWLWKDTLNNVGHYNDTTFWLHAILSVLIVFTVCIFIDRLRIITVERWFFSWYDEKKKNYQYKKLKGL